MLKAKQTHVNLLENYWLAKLAEVFLGSVCRHDRWCLLDGLITTGASDLFSSCVAMTLAPHCRSSSSASKASYEKFRICNDRLKKQCLQKIDFLLI